MKMPNMHKEDNKQLSSMAQTLMNASTLNMINLSINDLQTKDLQAGRNYTMTQKAITYSSCFN